MSLAQLRLETGPLHKALEEKLALFRKVNSKVDYANHLARLYQWLNPLEKRLGEFAGEILADWPQRKKTKWIEADLMSLGHRIPDSPPPSLPPCSSSAQCLGALYVLEGSSLGGQVVSRHFGRALGLRPECGLRYFTGYGEDTGPKWRAFLNRLEEFFSKRPDDAPEIIQSALATFRSYADFVPGSDE